jgi:hypothetical protein
MAPMLQTPGGHEVLTFSLQQKRTPVTSTMHIPRTGHKPHTCPRDTQGQETDCDVCIADTRCGAQPKASSLNKPCARDRTWLLSCRHVTDGRCGYLYSAVPKGQVSCFGLYPLVSLRLYTGPCFALQTAVPRRHHCLCFANTMNHPVV